MNAEKEKYYEKTVELLLATFKELRNSNSYTKNCELSDRKFKKIVKAYGAAFSRENVLFTDKFLLLEPSFVVAKNAIYYYKFEKSATDNGVLNFADIKKIHYNLMPGQTSIQITTNSGITQELYYGVPNAETVEAVKAYTYAVKNGSYKTYTICLLVCIYAFTALHRCVSEYADTYQKIEKNVKKMLLYQKDDTDIERKYGYFFSFDFVDCEYDPKMVDRALDKIASVAEELREERIAELKEQFAQTLERKMDEARQQIEKQNR